MPGSDDPRATWPAALLSNEHDLPVIALSGRSVRATNSAAGALFGAIDPDADVYSLFDDHAHGKLAALLAQKGASAATELQVARRGDLPIAVKFLLLPGPARECLLVACTTRTTDVGDASSKLLELNDQLVDLTRNLSRNVHDVDAERQALRQLGNLRELFIAAMAHDLKSPLQAIVLSEEQIKRSARPGERVDLQNHASRVQRQAQRMLFLVDSLLLAARLDSSTPGLPTEPVDLADIAREIAADFEAVAQEAQVRIEVACSGDARLRGNRVWLGEVFTNLLSNAARYSPRGTRIAVEVHGDGQRVHGAVSDRGPGVPAAQRETVFDRFVQHGERSGSVGLGLYVCRRVIELHGGRIWVEAAEGTGARFAFELPVRAS